MVTNSADLCDSCNTEYKVSTNQKECLAKVDHCKEMITGSIDEC